jgi:hypothetical protein
MKNVSFVTLVVLAACLATAPQARAQDLGVQAFGLRSGVSMNPDQFHFGAYLNAGHFTERVRFQPSFEIGLGNGLKLGALNADALYLFAPRRWRPYAGGGLGINFIDVTNGVGQARGLEIEPVLNLVGGIEWGVSKSKTGSRSLHRYLLEARLGLGDTPELKLTAGITF